MLVSIKSQPQSVIALLQARRPLAALTQVLVTQVLVSIKPPGLQRIGDSQLIAHSMHIMGLYKANGVLS